MAGRWVDVAEAARELGISTDAVRKRIARGSLESDRPNGNVLVWLDDCGTEAGREDQVDGGPLVESLRNQVAYLREIVATRDEEIRRRDVIISQLTQRIPEIEAPRESPVTPDSRGPRYPYLRRRRGSGGHRVGTGGAKAGFLVKAVRSAISRTGAKEADVDHEDIARQADEIARAVQQEREARVQKLRQELNIGPEIARYLQNLELRIENLERRPRS
jgi:hypothetical protein